jgi:group I intron endonuclease
MEVFMKDAYHYLVYKITNLVNDKIYIGVHKTLNINDNYMGSGKLLKMAQDKYGIENFKKEILHDFNNPEAMFGMESQLVNEKFIKESNTYNIKLGGKGGWDHIDNSGSNHPMYGKKHPNYIPPTLGKKHSGETKNKISESIRKTINSDNYVCRDMTGVNNPMYGKSHSASTKCKMKNSHLGNKNSAYGKCWIHSLKEETSKMVNKDELQLWLDDGWIKGRKLKF